jgi:hypothetical protein
MKCAVVKNSTLQAAGRWKRGPDGEWRQTNSGRWDSHYAIALMEVLKEKGLEENPANVKIAMQFIHDRDTATKDAARTLRTQAETLTEQARALDEEAELTFPLRNRF